MKVKSYFVLLKLEPFIGKMRQMWQSTNAFAVVQMTCDDMSSVSQALPHQNHALST